MAKNKRVSAQYRAHAFGYPELYSLHPTKGYRKKQMSRVEKVRAIEQGKIDSLVEKNLLLGSQCPFVR